MKKRGISPIISYVLLTVMVIALASGVYIWAKARISIPQEECPEGLSATITQCSYNEEEIKFTIQNTGNFNIDCFFIYFEMKNSSSISKNFNGITCSESEQLTKLNISQLRELSFSDSYQNLNKIKIVPVKIIESNGKFFPALCKESSVSILNCQDNTEGNIED